MDYFSIQKELTFYCLMQSKNPEKTIDKSIADRYTLRIMKEKIDTVVKAEIKNYLQMEDPDLNKADVYESDAYVSYLGQ